MGGRTVQTSPPSCHWGQFVLVENGADQVLFRFFFFHDLCIIVFFFPCVCCHTEGWEPTCPAWRVKIAVVVVQILCETGVSGHVRASECNGSCLNPTQCARVWIWRSSCLLLALQRSPSWSSGRGLGRTLGDCPPLNHSIKPEWNSFAGIDGWMTGYLLVQSCPINTSAKSV